MDSHYEYIPRMILVFEGMIFVISCSYIEPSVKFITKSVINPLML